MDWNRAKKKVGRPRKDEKRRSIAKVNARKRGSKASKRTRKGE
jgi:hypothetical protein